jgi:hypothetical protein
MAVEANHTYSNHGSMLLSNISTCWGHLKLFFTTSLYGPCHVSGNFLPFKGKSHSLSSQAARFFSFAKGEKKPFCKGIPLTWHGPMTLIKCNHFSKILCRVCMYTTKSLLLPYRMTIYRYSFKRKSQTDARNVTCYRVVCRDINHGRRGSTRQTRHFMRPSGFFSLSHHLSRAKRASLRCGG